MSKQHSLRANLTGSMIVGLLLNSPLIFIALVILRNFLPTKLPLDDLIFISLASAIISSTAIAVISRVHLIKLDRYTASGLFPTLYESVPWPLVTAAVTVTATAVSLHQQEPPAVWLGALAGLLGGTIPGLLLHQPWKEYMPDEDYEKNLQEGNRIIKEGFTEIRESISEKKRNC